MASTRGARTQSPRLKDITRGALARRVEGRIINVRRLVALDIFLHGPRFILIEFGVGTPAIIGFGAILAARTSGLEFYLGVYLILTGVNYIPALAYAVIMSRAKSARSEIEAEMAANPHYVRKYSVQQLLIMVPFAVVILAAVQYRGRV